MKQADLMDGSAFGGNLFSGQPAAGDRHPTGAQDQPGRLNEAAPEDPYRRCELCPRRCLVDRTGGERGFCREGTGLRAAFAGIHRGEEPPISVTVPPFTGSGTIFFTGCTLGCSFCQNFQISCGGMGREVDPGEFVEICLRLQRAGAANINLITATHMIPALRSALISARKAGLYIPTVWNTSSFESRAGLDSILPVIDIFLADLKTLDSRSSRWFSSCSDYPRPAVAAILRMAEERPLVYGPQGDLQQGVVVRHLVMPGELEQSLGVIAWFGEHLRERALFSLMVQFVDTAESSPLRGTDLSGKRLGLLKERDYDRLIHALDAWGIEEGFVQEFEKEPETDWIPDFSRRNPFPESFCDPVWHWRNGFSLLSD